jgi:hypothetical protein
MNNPTILGITFTISFLIFIAALISCCFKVIESAKYSNKPLIQRILATIQVLFTNLLQIVLFFSVDNEISAPKSYKQRKVFIIISIISAVTAAYCAISLYQINNVFG